jgi:hypothetical protein
MKAAFIATTFALASSAFAAPTHPKLQQSILTLENQILYVINDITQSSSNLKADYATGVAQFGVLANKLQGPLPCAPFVPGHPSTKKQAITALQTSQTSLMQLSLDLQNPENSIPEGDLHPDVCQALDYYAAVANFVADLKTSSA